MPDFLRQLLRLARKELSEPVEDSAVPVLVHVVEHADHVVTALKEEEVEDGQSAKNKRFRVFLTL